MIVPAEFAGPDSVASHYNDLDDFYREVWGEHVHHGLWRRGNETVEEAIEQLIDELAARAGIEPGSRVCDVGCGYGATARRLVDKLEADVLGLTISDAQYRFAQSLTPDSQSPQFLLRNWLHNELESESFDAVISIECFSHVDDKPRFFSEVARVLVPGGRAALAIWMAAEEATPRQVRQLLEPICREGRLAGLATQKEIREMIHQAELTLLDFEEVGAAVRKTWSICARRLSWKLATKRRYRQTLLDASKANRVFALTLFRILRAYRVGAMEYGLMTLVKPAAPLQATENMVEAVTPESAQSLVSEIAL